MSNTIGSIASYLFTKLDTASKGYIEKTDLESAFASVASSASTSSADELFSTLDGDGDGKVTQDEMSAGIRSLADALDGQFQKLRMASAMGGGGQMPPPPPPDDAGFTQEELASQLESIGSSDSKRASLISNIVANFSAADADGDGKVSFREAMAYDQGSTAKTTASAGSSEGDSQAATDELQLMLTVMQLVRAYQADSVTGTAATISTSA